MTNCTCGRRNIKVSGFGYTTGVQNVVNICSGCFDSPDNCICDPTSEYMEKDE